MRKLMLATIGLSFSMAMSAAAIAQSAQTPGQMQTGPSTNTDNNTGMPGGPNSGSMPQLPQTQGGGTDTTAGSGSMPADQGSSGSMSSGSMSSGTAAMPQPPMAGQKYPRCSKTVRDECRSGH